jgi:plasmid replication initiation protein
MERPLMSSKNMLVVKSNRLVEASYRLTLAEQRVILSAIAQSRQMKKPLTAETLVFIKATDYAQMYEMPLNQAYEQLKEAEKLIFQREFTLVDTRLETGEMFPLRSRWVFAAGHSNTAGMIGLMFSPLILPYITQLEEQFTRYKLEKVAKMSSVYAIRLYELLMQWESEGRRTVELEWLKKTLMVNEAYPRMFNFKKRVIDVAVAQINEFSDLTVSYEQCKTGRIVTHFIFTIALKEPVKPTQPKAEEMPADVRESPLFQRLRNLGIGPKLAGQWLQQDGARVAAALAYVEGKVKAGQVTGSAGGYLRKVFESGGAFGESAFEADMKAKAKAEAEAKKRAEAERRAKEKAEQEATEQAKATANALTALERLTLAEEYRLGPGAAYSGSWDAIKGDFRNSLERIQFKAWLVSRFRQIQAQ